MIIKEFENTSDEEVVKLVLNDQKYFIILVKRYETKLYRYISRISNFNDQEKEDILQDVFVKVYVNLNSFNSDLKFSSWIYRITRNEVINNFRKFKRRPQIARIDPEDDFMSRIRSGLDLEHEINNKVDLDNIKQILNEINDKYKEVLVLKFLEEKDYREISDILKIPMGTVATYINRGKKELKQKIKKYDKSR
ncbi:MAG TPA: sigma-70 family RNA polymerase sigma factor [Candidatus Pacearchaeota archaeon]|nr:sigma-70 family RNA polymerase sigma factor [Candidatus Pacearchaeota archaeon]